MFGRIPLSTLVLDDETIDFDRALLWVDADERWRLEVNPSDPRHMAAIRPDKFGTLRDVNMVTEDGVEYKGQVRLNHRRLYPFRGVPMLLEGVQALEGFTLETIDWHD